MKPIEGTKVKKRVIIVTPPSGKKKTIVVLGVERGGTSMVAGIVRTLGVNMGEQAGRNHEDPRFLTDDKDLLLERIKENDKKSSLWGFKVPKASLLLGFYDENLRNPHYILVFRNIEATVDSWCSRGPNDPILTAQHVMHYYSAVLDFFQDNKRPLIFTNYERACENPVGFVQDLAEFMGVRADESDVKRAASIVTGEGGGYLDLPEFYFHIDVMHASRWPSQSLKVELEEGEELLRNAKKSVDDMIVVRPDGEFFPKEFFLGMELISEGGGFIAEQGLRVYMDFTGEFFPGHAFRPEIHPGMNLFKISNNGNVRRVALGPLRDGFVYGMKQLGCYAYSGDEAGLFETTPPKVGLAREPLSKRVVNKIKSLLAE